MPKIHTITTYKFDELSEKAQKVAIKENYNINFQFYDWWENVYEDAKEIGLKITGFDITGGSYCNIDLVKTLPEICALIFSNHGESCDTYTVATKFHSAYYEEESEISKEGVTNCFNHALRNCYLKTLRNEYEYLQSDEAIKDTIICSDYEFLESGKLFNY